MWTGAQYCCGLGCLLTFMRRGEIRNQNSIKGDSVMDFALSVCCGCCVLIQQEKEVIGRQTQAGLVNNQGYVKQESMSTGAMDPGRTQ